MFKILAFAIALLIGIGFYIYFRIRPLMPEYNTWQGVLSRAVYVLFFISFIIGYILQSKGFYAFSFPFTYIGSWVLAAIMYFVIVFLLIDIFRLGNLLFKTDFLSFTYTVGNEKARMFSLCVSIVVTLILICGALVAKFPVTKHITFDTTKNLTQNIKFVLVSDVHLGMINCDSFFERLKDRINAENPDFVVIAGDFFDGDPYPVVNSRVGDILDEIRTGCGIYAINGNHEWLGNAYVADEFLTKHGVKVLRDSVAKLPFGVTIIGREDLSAGMREKVKLRKSLEEFTKDVDSNDFTILLDHQPPRSYDELVNAGIDLGLSGHTHAGAQLWPLFLITRRLYKNDYGIYREGNSTFYTTSGYGTWGPPVRTSSRPEMVVIELVKK